jgi:hypothetical protein
MVLKQDNQVHRSSTLKSPQSFKTNQDYSFYLVKFKPQSLSVVKKTLYVMERGDSQTPERRLEMDLRSRGASKLEINWIQPVATLGKGESMIIYSDDSKP